MNNLLGRMTHHNLSLDVHVFPLCSFSQYNKILFIVFTGIIQHRVQLRADGRARQTNDGEDEQMRLHCGGLRKRQLGCMPGLWRAIVSGENTSKHLRFLTFHTYRLDRFGLWRRLRCLPRFALAGVRCGQQMTWQEE